MGFSEIIFILFMVLVLFGADKLPEIARTLGKTIRQVRDATDEIRSEIQRGVEKTGIDTSFVEETQKEIEKMKEEIEQTNLLKK
ncbi:MAG: Sec-independent protein translocase subunit TatA/TatB [Capnocytophaga sp.]|mgnify:CR=1 FL=1|uniref:Sec-independent protein translocase subunit TatA/TatB n=1 Tax=Capnocytophaga sp. TaxID=44737 RepID=UPI0028F0D45D|nr:twin-arginine translocase TatA/TatE family subunit [uncultured Capnocytophaga sp.]